VGWYGVERKTIIINNEDIREMTFEEVIVQFKPFMYTLAKKWCKIYDVEDLNQVCLLGLFKSYNKYDVSKGYRFITYCGIVITNELKMYNRSESKHMKLLYLQDNAVEEENISYEDFVEDETNYEDKALEPIIIEEIYKALENLTERDRNIFIDYYINKLNQVKLEQKYQITQSVISRKLKKGIELVKNKVSYL
jgi:RNA polymerase sigma factor (sigma-70 family)